jgi:F-type H+-transporting ATPase subunit a
MKKRYLVWLLLILLIMVSFGILFPQPVRPYIQLAGERFPGSALTNTFLASLVVYGTLILIALGLRAGSRTADEIPSGFYNFFEMVIEGAYNFAESIAGAKVKDFFPHFMTILLFLLFANWMALIPGMDSIGVWEHKPHFFAEKDKKANPDLTADEKKALEAEYDTQNVGDLRVGMLLVRATTADESAPRQTLSTGEEIGRNPEAADWTIVPFFRPAATDLNLNLAMAVFAMIMVQFYGFKYLGASYLRKFFNFNKGVTNTFAKNPIEGIIKGLVDPIVGIIELVSEVAKVISFTFRLLGAIFGGMVLLFVMASIFPLANVAFFGLEMFVGGIQAIVFAMLTLIFMKAATESHHGDDHGDDHHH